MRERPCAGVIIAASSAQGVICVQQQNKTMRVRSSKKWQGIDKEDIINYQYRMIELSLPLVSPVIANTDKYLPWDLDAKVREVVGGSQAAVRWVGNATTAYLEAYAYLLLVATGLSQSGLLEFKHSIYRLGKKCLQLSEQKLLVEFLCLIEYSRDRYSFLNKYPQIQAILIKVLQYLQEEHTNSDDSAPQQSRKAKIRRRGQRSNQQGNSQQSRTLSQQMQYEKELQQIYQCFNKHFQFLTLLSSNEYSCTFRLLDSKKLHVIIEKQCYFMVEPMERVNDGPSSTQGNPKTDDRFASIDSSNVDFDRKEFLQIFEFKNQVQESNVISIQRGSQIRKPSTANMLQTIGSVHTPKFNNVITYTFPDPQEFEAQKHQERIQNDQTFIDELLNNVALHSDHQLNRGQPKEKPSAVKRKIENNMKSILTIKEELRIVRKKIEDKIKLIDQAQAQKDLIKKNYSPSQKPTSVKDRNSKKGQQFQGNIVKESVVKKHDSSLFLKKQRKTSYNSVKIIPYQSRHQKQDDLLDLQSLTSANRKSANHYVNRVERMLSEKGGSRAHSTLKPILEQEPRAARSKSPQAKRINNEFGVRSMSPKSVNVNVNVNINENHMSPPFQQHAYSRPLPHFYQPSHPQKQYPTSHHFPRAKIPNPEQHFPSHQPRFVLQTNKA